MAGSDRESSLFWGAWSHVRMPWPVPAQLKRLFSAGQKVSILWAVYFKFPRMVRLSRARLQWPSGIGMHGLFYILKKIKSLQTFIENFYSMEPWEKKPDTVSRSLTLFWGLAYKNVGAATFTVRFWWSRKYETVAFVLPHICVLYPGSAGQAVRQSLMVTRDKPWIKTSLKSFYGRTSSSNVNKCVWLDAQCVICVTYWKCFLFLHKAQHSLSAAPYSLEPQPACFLFNFPTLQ